jgi:hypothetical protein
MPMLHGQTCLDPDVIEIARRRFGVGRGVLFGIGFQPPFSVIRINLFRCYRTFQVTDLVGPVSFLRTLGFARGGL